MKFSRTGLTVAVVVAVTTATAAVWHTAGSSADRTADRAHTQALGGASPHASASSREAVKAAPAKPTKPEAHPTSSPVVDANSASGSVAYLRSQYGVSTTEALRRLDLQAEADQLDAQLRQSMPDTYAGMWLDQANGGLLRIATTRPSALASVVASLPDAAHVAIVPVQRSLQDLDQLAHTVSTQLPDSSGQVSVDVTLNQVVVYQTSGAIEAGRSVRTTQQMDAAQKSVANPDPRVVAVVSANPGVVLRQLVIGEEKSGPVPCQPIGSQLRSNVPVCPASRIADRLEAGSRLIIKRTTANYDSDNENPWYGECTLGFVVYDSSTGAVYALTAGHCLAGSDKTGINHVFDKHLIEVGTEDQIYQGTTYPADYGLIAINSPGQWFGNLPMNSILVHCTSVQSTGCAGAATSVTGVRTYGTGVGKGEVVCANGSGANDAWGYISSQLPPGTRCGEVTGTNGGFVTNICSRKGDSGGPLFSEATGLAYGILNDGTAGTSTCGNEWSQYTPVSVVISKINQQDVNNGGAGHLVIRVTP